LFSPCRFVGLLSLRRYFSGLLSSRPLLGNTRVLTPIAIFFRPLFITPILDWPSHTRKPPFLPRAIITHPGVLFPLLHPSSVPLKPSLAQRPLSIRWDHAGNPPLPLVVRGSFPARLFSPFVFFLGDRRSLSFFPLLFVLSVGYSLFRPVYPPS